MVSDHSQARLRRWYARLLRLYSRPFYLRFGAGMEQTFNDLLRERMARQDAVAGFAVWIFLETFTGIIQENIGFNIMQNKMIVRIAVITLLLLMIPLVAMQFTAEVDWNVMDFIVGAVLLFGTGAGFVLLTRAKENRLYRMAVGLALAAALLLVWVNLAVGIIGSASNGANLLYAGVLAIGIIGAIVVRLRSRGMATVLFVTALAQSLVVVIALMVDMNQDPGLSVVNFLLANLIFIAIWVSSGLLFRRAGAPQPV